MRAIWIGRVITLFALAQLSVIAPASAALPAAADGVAETVLPDQQIDADPAADADAKIATRLRGFFGVLDGFDTIDVTVEQGVVTLSGTLADQADIDEAENLARQVEGVVTVQNRIERDVSVDENLGALGGISGKFADFVQLLPLIVAAMLVALVIGGIGYVIAGFGAFWKRVMPNVFLAELVASAIRFVFVIGGLVIALDMIGAGALLGAVLGGAGVIGIALGFAMRDTVENYVASLMLSLRQPFRANDHVLIDDLEGRVIRLTSRATILMTLDGNHLRIPNGQVFKAVITNFTTNPQRRFAFELGIDADDDPNAARGLGRDVLQKLDFILDDPAPESRVVDVGDSNIVINFLGWIDQREADWHKARSRAIAAVKTALEDAGFGLPEPIYRLRFDPRTMPLPFENVESSKQASPESGKTKKPAVPAIEETVEDVSPEHEIARMVDAERAEDAGGDDLLDPARPSE